jgi:ubiquinone/menaquinone biosynthesis C-methylase UbiE
MDVLDLGSGTGNIAFKLKKLSNTNIFCTDISFEMLKKAYDKSLISICADANNHYLPFKNNSLDVIIGVYIIHHISNLKNLFMECHRILKNGTLIFLTSSHNQIEYYHPISKQFFPSCVDIEKNRFPDIDQITQLLRSVGFDKIIIDEVVIEISKIDKDYLKKVKSKYVSTYYLIPKNEFDNGLKKIEYLIRNKINKMIEWRGTLISGLKFI